MPVILTQPAQLTGQLLPSCPVHARWRPCQRAHQRATARRASEQSSRTQTDDGPLVKAGVAALTQSLRILGIGGRGPEQRSLSGASVPAPTSTAELMRQIELDYRERAYFVTGDLSEGAYADDCYFADPTVSFSGLAKWQSNLRLLVPFLIQPRIDLASLEQMPDSTLQATWHLTTTLKLPWRPLIDLDGATDYTLNAAGDKVCRHVERWSISGLKAIGQMLRPGPNLLSPKQL